MMTKINLDELIADREAGTDGSWLIKATSKNMTIQGNMHQITDAAGFPPAFVPAWDAPEPGEVEGTQEALANARRIARLPDLEAAFLEAVELLKNAMGIIENCSVECGYCCCGCKMDDHSIHSGHSPVDQGAYSADQFYRAAKDYLG